jgi:hypothetical protein
MADSTPQDRLDTDRNLLLGVLCLQADLLDATQFAEICTAWTARKDTSLASLLRERAWLTPEQEAHIDFLIACKLKKHQGNAHASLAGCANDSVQRVLAALADPDVTRSLADLPRQGEQVLLSTATFQPETRERYTLTRLHGEGGIGRVWLAHDRDLGREVALKELRPERANHPDVAGRFLAEAKITGQLEHPCIVPLYELVRRSADQQPFYTMRFVTRRPAPGSPARTTTWPGFAEPWDDFKEPRRLIARIWSFMPRWPLIIKP